MSKNKSSYPKNPAYQANPSAPPQEYQGQPGYPPPPYQQYATGVPAPVGAYPTANPNMMVAGPGYPPGYPQPYYPPPQPGYTPPANPGYPVQPGFNYSQCPAGPAVAVFDSGARFDGIASTNVPPPPPGWAPNAAQMAMAQGGPVVGTKKKGNWVTGGSGGGVAFW